MKKQYTIELPIYSYPVDFLAKINQRDDIQIILYGGVPDSPLNGGRFNYSIDGYNLKNRFLYKITKQQLARLTDSFYKTIEAANRNSIPFLIAYTNIFVDEKELTEENLKPIDYLIANYKTTGTKNGVIINNLFLEEHLRKKYLQDLLYVSSCTKYVSPEKILNPKETIQLYVQDSTKYDFVVLTPQHSRKKNIITDVNSQSEGNIIAISNSYCSDRCNSYHHYVYMSQENKKSLVNSKAIDIFASSYNFLFKHATKCSVFKYQIRKIPVNKYVKMQLSCGIRNFKIGRGLGAKCLEEIIATIKKHKT